VRLEDSTIDANAVVPSVRVTRSDEQTRDSLRNVERSSAMASLLSETANGDTRLSSLTRRPVSCAVEHAADATGEKGAVFGRIHSTTNSTATPLFSMRGVDPTVDRLLRSVNASCSQIFVSLAF